MVLSMDRWVGKVAVVTGASSGIGAAIAEALVEKGLIRHDSSKPAPIDGFHISLQDGTATNLEARKSGKVAGLARRVGNVEALSKKLSGKKGKLHAVKTDVGKEEDILNAFKWVKQNLGPIHVLVNNAGVLTPGSIMDGDTEVWRNILAVNVLGLSIATREAVRDMKVNKTDGHIIHINSILGHKVDSSSILNIYPASKFAVTALAETLRLELLSQKSKIKITSLSPGPVDTEMIPDLIRENFPNAVEQKKIIEPENIADAVVYVLSTPPHVQIQELTVRSVDETFAE